MKKNITVKLVTLFFAVAFMTMSFWSSTYAADIYKGYGESSENITKTWGVGEERLTKITDIKRVLNIDDITTYSAYITNNEKFVGEKIENAFTWFDKSRLAYTKLIKVEGGKTISFVFSDSVYLYCAEFDEEFRLLKDGDWKTIGDTLTLSKNTKWIMVVFRSDNGNLESGAGTGGEIMPGTINDLKYKYVVFEPFEYKYNLNGGKYNNTETSFIQKRLGVEAYSMPVPTKKGYVFSGWKHSGGKVYSGNLKKEYSEELFNDCSFTAQWEPVKAQKITLNKDHVILEQNTQEKAVLTGEVLPLETLDKNITWESSDTGVATITKDGEITPHNTGTAVITAKADGGATASCKVYVMGFEVEIPDDCLLKSPTLIKVNVYNNGEAGMTDRKHIVLTTDNEVDLSRKGDPKTSAKAGTEYCTQENGAYSRPGKDGCIYDSADSGTVFYRLLPSEILKRAGEYEGNINFKVAVR